MPDLSMFPINMWQWLIGAIATAVFGYKSLTNWHLTRNKLSLLHACFGGFITVSLGAYFASGLAVPDYKLAHQVTLFGDVFLYASLILQGNILTLLVFKDSRKIKQAIATAVLLGLAASLYFSLTAGYMYLEDGFLYYGAPYVVAFLRGGFVGTLFIPIGWQFIKSARKKLSTDSMHKAAVIGTVYIAVGTSTMHRDIILAGIEGYTYVILNIFFFSVFLISLLITGTKES